MACLHKKYHPTDNVDIPKVEFSTGGSTPVSLLFLTTVQINKSSNSPRKLKYTVVTKYMNLPSRAGIGYQLSNGDIGILCNNGEKLL